MAAREVCYVCAAIHDTDAMYHRVGGWARPRTDGGVHALRLRRSDLSIRICHGCMEELINRAEGGRPVPSYATDTLFPDLPQEPR